MRRKLLFTYILVIAVTVLVTVIFSWSNFNDHFYDQAEKEAKVELRLLKQVLEYEYVIEDFSFQEYADEYGRDKELRITVIDSDGVVIADNFSDPLEMENHKYREEFKGALNGEEQTSLRYSATIQEYSFYYATPLSFDDFNGALRIAIPIEIIENLVWDLVNSVIVGLIIGIVLSVGIAYVFSSRIMTPIYELKETAEIIASGDYDHKVYVDDQQEIGQLANAFNTMTFTLRKTIWETETQNAELEAILTSMDTGLAAIDENYKIMLCNDPFKELLALEDVVEGKIFYEVSRNPILFSVIEKSIDEGEYITEETRLKLAGEERILNFSATPIKSKNEKYVKHGVLLSVDDVTNLRKLENIRRDFVSNVTHELKTPLTSIKGFVDALKTGGMDDPVMSERFLDIIDIESDRLTLLIEDILSLSEIESMRLDKQTGYYVVENIIKEVCELLEGKASNKNIDLIVDIQADMKELKCNRNRMKQLIINLMDNAIKYTEEGSVTIECKESRDRKFMILNVIDTGIGIEEEHLERLFERFYRVDKGRSRKMGGTGLGLSIVKHITSLYNGSVEVMSKYGEGTTIKVRIPFE